MNEIINEKVTVVTIYDAHRRVVMPAKLRWRGRQYRINKLGYHHKLREGRTLLHIFSVANETTAFKLSLNTDNLTWTLVEIYDQFDA